MHKPQGPRRRNELWADWLLTKGGRMTICYPDISSYNTGVSLSGAPAVCIKVTEGTSYVNGSTPAASPSTGRTSPPTTAGPDCR